IFLTFDVDWASDEVIADSLNIVEKQDIKSTWFVTHNSPILERLKENENIELGIHPNFNFLLNGDFRNGRNAEEVVDRLLEIVPNAKSVRSHAMTQSSGLLELFYNKGLTHDCNHFIPEQTEIILKPWYLWNNLIKVPYFWEDDINCVSENRTAINDLVNRKGIKVFDFHPIHVFLNIENIDRYYKIRNFQKETDKLLPYINTKEIGVKDLLKQLITA
ncbi:MAG: hypothetical protein HQ463_00305, partial [Bacteroidetes bacterium]|nr:hypothetical protein [Bacteroidota bacterium]